MTRSRKVSNFVLLAIGLAGFVLMLAAQTILRSDFRPPGYYPDDPLPDHTVYLTFDDGPSAWTEMVLNTLRERNIKATFFVSAKWQPGMTVEYNSFTKYRHILQRIVREGHSLGNHTANHRNLAGLDRAGIEWEFLLNQVLLDIELGNETVDMKLLRPPFGSPWIMPHAVDERRKVSRALAGKGYVILWTQHFFSGDAVDWVRGDWFEEDPRLDISQDEFRKKMTVIYNRMISRVDGKGMVMLFHDTHRTSVEILPKIIDRLIELGYRFDTIDGYVRWRYEQK